jgi:hypothetical protein
MVVSFLVLVCTTFFIDWYLVRTYMFSRLPYRASRWIIQISTIFPWYNSSFLLIFVYGYYVFFFLLSLTPLPVPLCIYINKNKLLNVYKSITWERLNWFSWFLFFCFCYCLNKIWKIVFRKFPEQAEHF